MRLFVAIGLPPEVRQTLGRLQGSIAGARWVAESDLHLTLCFIGDVGAGDVFEIEVELAGVNFPAFDIILCELGTFERRGKVHTLWAGVERAPALIRLHEKIAAAVERAGFAPEKRKYKPHVSMARFSRSLGPDIGPFIEANNTLLSGDFPVRNFSLYRSHLGSGGARYEVLSRFDLTEMAY